jgi:di/tricarboxylate transporter
VNQFTAIALAAFLIAFGIENVVVAIFVRQFRARHPGQWSQAFGSPGAWTTTGVFAVARYMREYGFLEQRDKSVIRFCRSRRAAILAAYRATVLMGLALMSCILLKGW